MLPKNVSEGEVSELFSQYGTLKDLQILRGSQQTSKGTYEYDYDIFLAFDSVTHFWGLVFTIMNYGRLCFCEV